MYVCMYVYMYVCMHVYMYVAYVCMYVRMYECMHVCKVNLPEGRSVPRHALQGGAYLSLLDKRKE